MGKTLIQQKRGKGSPTWRAPSFRYKGKSEHRPYDNQTVTGTVTDIVHCQGHSAPMLEVKYQDGKETLTIASEGIRVGDQVTAGNESTMAVGNTLALEVIPEGTLVYNIESTPGDGGKFVRCSGAFAKIVGKSQGQVTIILPSKKIKIFDSRCRATIGIVAGGGRKEKPFVKAGTRFYAMKARNKLYPKVRGVAMNAVAHPFGGTSSHHKGRPTVAPRYAPAGRNVGKLRPRRTGRTKR